MAGDLLSRCDDAVLSDAHSTGLSNLTLVAVVAVDLDGSSLIILFIAVSTCDVDSDDRARSVRRESCERAGRSAACDIACTALNENVLPS